MNEQTLNQLLVEMDGFDKMVLLLLPQQTTMMFLIALLPLVVLIRLSLIVPM